MWAVRGAVEGKGGRWGGRCACHYCQGRVFPSPAASSPPPPNPHPQVLAAPMLLSQSIVNMTANRLETYTNEEVIGVGQDIWGRQGQRLVGGPISGGGDGNTPLTLEPCAGGAPEQAWDLGAVSPGFLSLRNSTTCANVDDCGSALIAFECVTTGGTCCGATCYNNEIFTLNSEGAGGGLLPWLRARPAFIVDGRCSRVFALPLAPSRAAADGTLRSAMGANLCVTSGGLGAQASLSQCTGASSAQQFAYDAATGELTSGGACLTSGGGGAAANRTNVWGRPLSDGSWALVFINAGSAAANISCSYADCLSQLGWEAEVNITVGGCRLRLLQERIAPPVPHPIFPPIAGPRPVGPPGLGHIQCRRRPGRPGGCASGRCRHGPCDARIRHWHPPGSTCHRHWSCRSSHCCEARRRCAWP